MYPPIAIDVVPFVVTNVPCDWWSSSVAYLPKVATTASRSCFIIPGLHATAASPDPCCCCSCCRELPLPLKQSPKKHFLHKLCVLLVCQEHISQQSLPPAGRHMTARRVCFVIERRGPSLLRAGRHTESPGHWHPLQGLREPGWLPLKSHRTCIAVWFQGSRDRIYIFVSI